MDKSIKTNYDLNLQQFVHGTKPQLKQGYLIAPGINSNYGKHNKALFVYLRATLDAAI